MTEFSSHKIPLALLAFLSAIAITLEDPTSQTMFTNFKNLHEKLDFLTKEMEKVNWRLLTKNNANDANASLILTKINKLFEKIDEISQKVIDENQQEDEEADRGESDVVCKMRSKGHSTCRFKVSHLGADNGSNDVNAHAGSSLKKENEKSLNLCEPNPCLYGGKCQMTLGDYECTGCHKLTSGKNCQDLNCGYGNCFWRNDTLYQVIETLSGWESANRKCIEERMSLVMPKDEETNQFLINQLISVYGKFDLNFWLGVRRDANGWRWADGSALGNYTGGNIYFRLNDSHQYGILANNRHGTFYWGYAVLSSSYFPICQTNPIPH